MEKCAIEIPSEREAAVFVFLEALEFFDQVYFEFGTNPHSEFKGYVLVSVCASITTCCGFQANGPGFIHPVLDADFIAVQSSVAFNCGEFAIIKSWVVDRFPNSQELDGVSVAQPIGDEKITVLCFEHIGEGNKIISFDVEDGDFPALNLDVGFFGLWHGERKLEVRKRKYEGRMRLRRCAA